MHQSISVNLSNAESKDFISSLVLKDEDKGSLCVLCVKNKFKSTNPTKVRKHIKESHLSNSMITEQPEVSNNKFIIMPCRQTCRGDTLQRCHWHCPYCKDGKTVERAPDFRNHLENAHKATVHDQSKKRNLCGNGAGVSMKRKNDSINNAMQEKNKKLRTGDGKDGSTEKMPQSSGIPCYIDGQQQKLPMDLAERIPLTTPVESSEKNTTNGKDDKDYPRENHHIVADVPEVSVQLKKTNHPNIPALENPPLADGPINSNKEVIVSVKSQASTESQEPYSLSQIIGGAPRKRLKSSKIIQSRRKHETDATSFSEIKNSMSDKTNAASMPQNTLQKKKRRNTKKEYDIDQIVIAKDMMAQSRIEKLVYKEIETPKWTKLERYSQYGDVSNMHDSLSITNKLNAEEFEIEDTSDAAFAERHAPLVKIEREKYGNFIQKTKRRCSQKKVRKKSPHAANRMDSLDSNAESQELLWPQRIFPLTDKEYAALYGNIPPQSHEQPATSMLDTVLIIPKIEDLSVKTAVNMTINKKSPLQEETNSTMPVECSSQTVTSDFENESASDDEMDHQKSEEWKVSELENRSKKGQKIKDPIILKFTRIK